MFLSILSLIVPLIYRSVLFKVIKKIFVQFFISREYKCANKSLHGLLIAIVFWYFTIFNKTSEFYKLNWRGNTTMGYFIINTLLFEKIIIECETIKLIYILDKTWSKSTPQKLEDSLECWEILLRPFSNNIFLAPL